MSILGTRVIRTEDPRLLTVGGVYVDDLRTPELNGAARVTFVRSPLAHARITGIDASEALAEPGVVAVLTVADMDDLAPPPPSSGEWDGSPAPLGGPWAEPLLAIDTVRFVGNRSSGRMGVALAEEARRRGAEVTLLAANLAVPPPRGIEVVDTPTAATLLDEALAHGDADVVLMAAAVADYRPAEPAAEKRPKDELAWQVTLEPTIDVLRTLGERRTNGQVLIGFAADHGEQGLARAREKLERKRVDLVVYNDVSRGDIGFDAGDNEVVLITAAGERRVAKAPKDRIAATIVDTAEELLRERAR